MAWRGVRGQVGRSPTERTAYAIASPGTRDPTGRGYGGPVTTVSKDAPDLRALEGLAESLTPGALLTEPDSVAAYRFDYTADAGAGVPLAVVRASSAADVQATVRWAGEHGVPVVPRGAGSGLSGGANAVDGCIVLSLERMRAVEIDPATRTAVVEAGALNVEVKQAAAEHGLWYPPDPSSFEICSIGGNVATNAGGLCCVKYGVTTDYVLGLDVVLADGTLVHLGGQRVKDAAGLSLRQALRRQRGHARHRDPGDRCGSSRRRRRPRRSSPPSTPSRTRPGRSSPSATPCAPSMMELMDQASINAVEDHRSMGLDRDGRRDAARAVRRARRSPRRGDRRHGAAVRGRRRARVLHDDDAGRGRDVRRGPPRRHRRHRAARRDHARGRRGAGAAAARPARPASPRSPRRHDVEIPVVAHAGDGNTHPVIVYAAGDAGRRGRARPRPSSRS